MPACPTSLILEDDATLARVYERVLQSLGYEVTVSHRIEDARAQIRNRAPDLLLIDVDLPDGNGLDLMAELRNDTRGRFIVISGDDSQRAAIKSIRNQAVELLIKPVDLASLRNLLAPVVDEHGSGDDMSAAGEHSGLKQVRRGTTTGRREPSFSRTTARICKTGWFQVGENHALVALRTAMSYSAERSRGHALLTGERGVDKPSVARAIHARGRRTGSCLVIDCTDENGPLAMVRMFGQEDPNTGEVLHRGYIEQAAAGTLVLDHVEKLPIEMQSRLLPFLDTGTFRRVDARCGVEATLAIIGITRDAGTQDVDETRLRTDFLFRLAQTTLAVPNLRQCRNDIQAIADNLLAEASAGRPGELRFSPASRRIIASTHWQRNIRELRSVIQQAVAVNRDGDDVEIQRQTGTSVAKPESDIRQWVGTSIWEFERQLLDATLLHFDGDKEKTAHTLGVSLKTLYNRMNAY